MQGPKGDAGTQGKERNSRKRHEHKEKTRTQVKDRNLRRRREHNKMTEIQINDRDPKKLQESKGKTETQEQEKISREHRNPRGRQEPKKKTGTQECKRSYRTKSLISSHMLCEAVPMVQAPMSSVQHLTALHRTLKTYYSFCGSSSSKMVLRLPEQIKVHKTVGIELDHPKTRHQKIAWISSSLTSNWTPQDSVKWEIVCVWKL